MIRPSSRRWMLTLGATVTLLVTAACGGGTSSSTPATSSAAAESPAAASSAPAPSSGAPSTAPSAEGAAAGVPTMDQLYKGTDEQPPSSSPPRATGKNLWWISCGQASPDCATKAAAGKAATEAMGWQFHLADANLGANGAYDTTVRTAIAAKADVIVQDAFSCARNKAPLTEAKQKGILVLGIEALDCDVTGDGESLFTVPFIYNSTMKTGSDYWSTFGTFAADAIINQSGGKAKVITNGGNGDPEFDLMNKGFSTELAKCSGCTVAKNVDWVIADLAPNGPWITAFRSTLTKTPDATHVYLPFAFMAVGLNGAQAMRESGTTAKGFGGFGSSDILDLVRNGQWDTATSAYDLDWIGWGAVDAINRAFNKSPAVPEGIGYAAVDKSHNLPATAGTDYHSAIDFKAAYKKAWGVG